MELIFENSLGTIRIGGGGDTPWRLISIGGLELPPKNVQTARYAYEDGQEVLYETVSPRTITIGGDLQCSDSDLPVITKAAKIFAKGGCLKVLKENKRRKIYCRCTSFEPEIRQGGIRRFVLQFICDDPYFYDLKDSSTYVNFTRKLLGGSFIFGNGIQFSQRTNSGIVTNDGDALLQPVFHIKNIDVDMQKDTELVVENKTTGQRITVFCKLKNSETIMIDVAGREVIGGKGESIINSISNDTYLSDFYLEGGGNEIVARCSSRISVTCRHNNKYLEAVV